MTGGEPEVDDGDYVRIPGKISNRNNGLLMYLPKIEAANSPTNIFQFCFRVVNSLRERLISLFS